MKTLLAAAALVVSTVPAAASAAPTALCAGVSVGPAVEVVSNQDRQAHHLDEWPDTAFGYLPDQGLLLAAGLNQPGGHAVVVVTKGTPDNPIAGDVVARNDVTGAPAGFQYVSGGPVLSVDGTVLQTVHAEHRHFSSELLIGAFDPATYTTRYLATAVTPAASPDQVRLAGVDADLGDPILVRRDDYLYLYFPDFRSDGNGGIGSTVLSVARAKVSDVLAGTAGAWSKHNQGSWDQPGVGGVSSSIQSGSMAWAPAVTSFGGGTLMVAGDSAHEFVLATSTDGLLTWSDRVTLFRDPDSIDAYPTVVPGPQANQFSVFYTQWPQTTTPNWGNAHLMRRLVTCTGGQPAASSTLIGYTNGSHDRTSTDLVTAAGFYPGSGSTWRIPATEQPGTVRLLSCRTSADDYMPSTDPNCESANNWLLATLGWLYTSPPAQPSVPLYRCYPAAGNDHYLWTDTGCRGGRLDGLLGYALTTTRVPFSLYANGTGLHWATSGPVTADYTAQRQWFLDGSTALYGCEYAVPGGTDHMVSLDQRCEGVTFDRVEGKVGAGGVPLYRCYRAATYDHFVWDDSGCAGASTESLLGYAVAA